MGNKHRIDGICKMLYFIYATFLIYPVKVLINIGLFSKNIKIFNIIDSVQIGYSACFFIFQIMFLSILYFGIKSSLKNIEIFEDQDKFEKIRKKLIPYKIFVIITVTVSIIAIYISRYKELIIPSIFLIMISILIHFSKETYFKSYLFDRKLLWIESVNGEQYDESDIDSKKWRYRIWCDKKEKVKFKYRKTNIVINILHIIGFSFFAMATNTDIIFFSVIWLYFIVFHIITLIENIFNLFTSIDGMCTGIYEQSTRTRRYYNIIVTDYKNKREIKVKIDSSFYIKEGDYLSVVHGIFSKRLISINSINFDRGNIGAIISPLIVISFFVAPNAHYMGANLLNKVNYALKNEPVLDFDERQKLENPKEILTLNEDFYDKVITINKEKNFNDISININKLYLGKNNSKVLFIITNNTSRGMVLNVDYYAHIKDDEGENSNILLPGKTYNIELDIYEKYNKREHKRLLLNLEYTLSETILNEYLDFNYYYYYPLNVIDNDCMIYINLEDGNAEMNFNEYNEFYTKSEEVIKFIK